MARRNSVSVASSRRVQARLKPVAQAVVLLSVWAGQMDAHAGGLAVRLAQPYARPVSVDTSALTAPYALTLPQAGKAWTDANGNTQNVASYGSTTGVVTVKPGADGSLFSTLDLTQSTQRAIVLFNSFDIGKQATVNVYMGSASSSALYQVSGSTAPSQVYGHLNSYVKDSAGNLSTGGEIYLINPNGILFGKGVQVNVGALFATTLSVPDNADFYNNGITTAINGTGAAFKWVSPDGIATYAPQSAFVKVDNGASITTATGGRVFLLGGQVENAGQITTPNGQTVLAAGSEVYLSNPTGTATTLYMSEANDKVPTVKGLLVEVNGSKVDQEFASNTQTGVISTPTGNATIVGWAVNQLGRINATTSVTQNGSVYLLARSGTIASASTVKKAKDGGTLTLGQGSSVSITPDSTPDASGHVVTTAANAVFTPSRVEMSGKTITMAEGASVVAPGGTVNVRASSVPVYQATDVPDVGAINDDGTGTISMASGAKIDVSGTTDTSVSVDRNFVTTALLGAQDLKDAPLQKDGPIYRSKLTFDIRSASPILGDTSAYTNAVQKSAGEFMAAGGNVVLSATGKVDVAAGAQINVSGGLIKYSDALVQPSVLVAEDGQRYTLNTAPADVKYVAIAGQQTGTTTRFGSTAAGDASPLGHVEAGYTEGKAAGAISVYASVAHIDGQVKGGVTMGARQKAGLDPLATAGTLRLGTASNLVGTDTLAIGAKDFVTAVMKNLVVATDVNTLAADPALNDVSRIAASNVQDGGFGNVQFTADHGITQQAGANLTLGNQSSIKLQSNGQVTLGGSITTHGGSITVGAYDKTVDTAGSTGVTVLSGAVLDASGNWVNQRIDGGTVAAAVAGGKVTLKSDHSLVVASGSSIDVSGGVTVTQAGALVGTAAGGITLEGLNASTVTGTEQVQVQGDLKGYSLGKGGSLRIKAGSINVTGQGAGIAQHIDLVKLADGEKVDGTVKVDTIDGVKYKEVLRQTGLDVGGKFFSTGGFQSFDLDGRNSLTVSTGTTVAPTLSVWQATAAGRNATTGTPVSAHMVMDQRADTVRNPVNIALASSGTETGAGVLSLQTGSVIEANPQATITLKAGHAIEVDGRVRSMGGTIAASVAAGQNDDDALNHINLGAHAVLDVSGGPVYVAQNNGRLNGKVVDGGSIALSVTKSNYQSDASVDVAKGAQVLADGGTVLNDVARPAGQLFGPSYSRQTLASNGGSISIQTGSGGARLAGTLSAAKGDQTATGGALSIQLGALDVANRTSEQSAGTYVLNVQDAAVTDKAVAHNQVTVSQQAVKEGGFVSLNLTSLDKVNFVGNVALDLKAHLKIDAPVISATGNGSVSLNAASTLQLGSSQLLSTNPGASGGTATLTAQSGLIELFGTQATQGLGTIKLNSGSELRLRGMEVKGSARNVGAFNTAADLKLNAQQVTPTTATDYTINTPGDVTFGKGNVSATPVLSAQASLTVNAKTIDQNGVLRAPFGKISLNATDSLKLETGSETSVSGQGLLVPYGATSDGGSTWSYNGQTLTSLKGKAISLDASGQTVTTQAGATLNLDGGGQLVAYEFVQGPGGSKDIFTGAAGGAFAIVPTVKDYSPYDSQIMVGNGSALTLNPGAGNTLSLGNTLTFGTGAMIPAGTYAILPARYALLPGAYLVKANASVANVSLGYAQTRPDGSQVVAALQGVTGVAVAGNAQPGAYTVMSSAQARRYSEVKSTDVDTYLSNKADLAGTAVGPLSRDAGHLSLVADQLSLDAKVLMGVASGGRGGLLDIAASKMHVGGKADGNDGVLNLSAQQINDTGAASILIGGKREDPDANGVSAVTVVADVVTVDATDKTTLSVNDLTLAAQKTLNVNDGVRIEAPTTGTAGTGSAPSLSFTGDGALLRVSSSTSAQTVRSGNLTRTQGSLNLGQGLSLKGGSITAEGTAATSIASALQSASTIQASSLTIGASRIEVGTGAGATASDHPLVLTDALAAQLQAAQNLTLRSYSTVDMYGQAQIGGGSTAKLTLDTAAIRLKDVITPSSVTRAQAVLQAGQVTLANTTGQTLSADVGKGSLTVIATGQQAGSGHVTLASGVVAVSGAQTTTVKAAGSVVFQGAGGLNVPGSLDVQAQNLTATQAAQGQLTATGAVTLAPTTLTGGTVATAGTGASVQVDAASFTHNGRIDLPSGQLAVNAKQSVQFTGTSNTNLAGTSKTIDGVNLSTVGGTLKVNAEAGNITLASGSVVDVSAAGGNSTAGSMSFTAPLGTVSLQGRLLATSSSGQSGGSLTVDSQNALNLGDLAQRIAAESAGQLSNFAQSISLRNRMGSQTLDKDSTLQARNLDLSTDNGKLTIAGHLLANGSAAGGSVQLNAGGDVVVASTADIQAKATSAGQGGQVSIGSTAGADGVVGTVRLQGGGIDTSGAAGGDDGSISIRARQQGTGVAVDAIGSTLTGVKQINVEAFKAYARTALTANDVSTMKSDAATYLKTGSTVLGKLSGGNAALSSKLRLRAGAEVDATGNLTLSTTDGLGNSSLPDGILLTTSSGGKSVAPMNLTIRATGNLTVNTGISDGFSTTTAKGVPQAGLGGDIRLVAGADLKSSKVMATVASAKGGDLTIGDDTGAGNAVIVRTTTGNIQLAAGRDITLLDGNAVVYTTGAPVTTAVGYVKPSGNGTASLTANTLATPFLSGGGNISLDAQRDVAWLNTGAQQAVTNWSYRFKNKSASNQISWWNRPDLFQQGVATLGGGDVTINAGRDAWNVNAFAANSGYVKDSGQTITYGGGSVQVSAGRDVVGGMVGATQNVLVSAGRDVSTARTDNDLRTDHLPTQNLTVVMGDGSNRVLARNDLHLDAVTLVGRLSPVKESTVALVNTQQVPGQLYRPMDSASLELASTSGDLSVDNTANVNVILPGKATLSAAAGSLTLADVSEQSAAPATSLSILAMGDVNAGAINQMGADARVSTVTAIAPASASNLSGDGSTPTRIVSQAGAVTYSGAIKLTTPLRLIAGKDINAAGQLSQLLIQHQKTTDLSLIQAGRDFNLSDSVPAFGVEVRGPGDLIIATGRSADLKSTTGLVASGNLNNTNLPKGSANITMLSGVSFADGDVADAVAAGFPLLGGQGVGAQLSLMLKQINGDDGSQLSGAQWLSRAQALAGDATYQSLALAYINHREDATLLPADALKQVATLSDADKGKLAGQVLAKVWSGTVSAAQQSSTILSLVNDSSKAQALIDFVKVRTGKSGLSLAQSWQAYVALPVEQQALLVTRTLSTEVASAIGKASILTGSERDAAYAQGYDAMSTVFDHATAQTSTLSLSSSQIKTLQGSAVNIFNPNGGVNVGQLSNSALLSRVSADLGIVTAAGGDVNVLVRDDVAVNTSRIFTLVKGDETIWSSLGNVDAGRGAKTVTSTPTPVYYIDSSGNLQVDVSSAISGNGISATGNAHIAAPKGEINAGDAGISATKGLDLAAQIIKGADAIAAPVIRGAPPPAAVNLAVAVAAPVQPTAAGGGDNNGKDDANKARRRKRNVVLEFLGFGVEDK
jgi:filamentous hemagglutinin family protein